MASDPVPTPLPYLDPQNTAFLQQFGKVLNGADLTQVSVQQAREFVHEVQEPAPTHPDVTVSSFMVKTTHGDVETFVAKPTNATSDDLPVIFHIHGGGWFLINEFDEQAFIFDLVRRTGFAVVWPEYSLAPEKRFPVQQEQCLDVLAYVVEHGHSKGLRTDKVVVSGDSAGTQLAIAVSILSHQRQLNLPIAHQILFHPVVSAMDLTSTFSQFIFQNGPVLSNAFFVEAFNDYFGPNEVTNRSLITASPILMTPAQIKEFMPPTTIITAQNDWLRDQGENFAKLLQTSGVECGVLQAVACVHDCEIFNTSRTSPTVELFMLGVAGKIREVFMSGVKADCRNGKKRKVEL